jgi:urease accessory protein UreF
MNAIVEQSLLSKIRSLSPQQVAEVENFVEFLAAKSRRRAALNRLLAVAPALEAAGVEPMSEEEIAAEVKAARAERRARQPSAQRGDEEAGAPRS